MSISTKRRCLRPPPSRRRRPRVAAMRRQTRTVGRARLIFARFARPSAWRRPCCCRSRPGSPRPLLIRTPGCVNSRPRSPRARRTGFLRPAPHPAPACWADRAAARAARRRRHRSTSGVFLMRGWDSCAALWDSGGNSVRMSDIDMQVMSGKRPHQAPPDPRSGPHHCQAFLLGAAAWLALAGAAWAQAEPDPASVIGVAALPRDLTPWGMFMSAHPVVKCVIIGLALASVVTWTIWLAKTIELLGAKRKLRAAIERLSSAASLPEAQSAGTTRPAVAFIAAALAEIRLSADAPDKDGLKERIAPPLERIDAAYSRKLIPSTSVLATLGGPRAFLGVFVTVSGRITSCIA